MRVLTVVSILVVVCVPDSISARDGDTTPAKRNGKCKEEPWGPPHGPGLKISWERKWDEPPSCDDNTDNAFDPFNITVTAFEFRDGKLSLKIDNPTYRLLYSLKCRLFFQDKTKNPLEFEIGPLREFTGYTYDLEVNGLKSIDEVETTIEIVLPNPWYRVGVKKLYACNVNLTYVAVSGPQMKAVARLMGDMHYLINTPEARELFMFGPENVGKWRGWVDRAFHLDHYAYVWKNWLFGVIKNDFFAEGEGDGWDDWTLHTGFQAIKAYYLKRYNEVGESHVLLFFHEMAHGYMYGHHDWAQQGLQGVLHDRVFPALQEQCVFQYYVPPTEKYEDNILLSAALNEIMGHLYIFSAYSLRVFKLKDGKTDSEQARCVLPDESCAWNNRGVCLYLGAYSGNVSRTKSGKPCQQWNALGGTYRNLPENFCRALDGFAPGCFTEDYSWEECFPTCYKNLPKDFPEIYRCLNPDNRTCAWSMSDHCKVNGIMDDETKLLMDGEYCQKDYFFGTHQKHGFGCINAEGKWIKGYKQCYEPSTDERLYVPDIFPEFNFPVKYAFPSPDGKHLVLVPFVRNQSSTEAMAYFYYWGLENAVLIKKTLLSHVFPLPSGSLYNPHIVPGIGLFHGSQICRYGNISTVSECTNVFTDPDWAFLKKFKTGPADLHLAFNGGDGFAYFFKDTEYIKYNLKTQLPINGFPKPTSEFLSFLGQRGESYAALS